MRMIIILVKQKKKNNEKIMIMKAVAVITDGKLVLLKFNNG